MRSPPNRQITTPLNVLAAAVAIGPEKSRGSDEHLDQVGTGQVELKSVISHIQGFNSLGDIAAKWILIHNLQVNIKK